MAWRMWSKLCCGQKWILLLSPLFLLFLTVCMMTVTLPLPSPPSDIDRWPSRALSSAREFRSRRRVMDPPPPAAFQKPLSLILPSIHSRVWKTSSGKETSRHAVPANPVGDAAGDDKNRLKERSHANLSKNKHQSKGIGSRRKEISGAIQHPTSHHHLHLPEFTVNNSGPKHRIKQNDHSSVVRNKAETYIHLERRKSTIPHIPSATDTLMSDRRAAGQWKDRHANRNAHTEIHGRRTNTKPVEKHRRSGKSDTVSKEQQGMKEPSRNHKKHHIVSEDPSEIKEDPGLVDHTKTSSKLKAAVKKDDGRWCWSFRQQDFPESDHRRIRISRDLRPVPWLSNDDIHKMELLAGGEVVSKARVPAHGQVLQVALDALTEHQTKSPYPGLGPEQTHSDRCQRGRCSLVKRTDDWFEVFAFHLDRVLGLNRSLPAVLRTFHSQILPYRYTSGTPRPVVWWDPDIQHLEDSDNDQNSVPLSFVQYQKLLKVGCGRDVDVNSAPCVGVHHSEWGRLALFDFLLQVNDRLDRYCCGFRPDPSELCVENLLNTKCRNTKDLLLVHILVRKADPSKLVFIDNAGRPEQPADNLNFRLVEGIEEFPQKAVSVLQSGCLESLLLRSLYSDREFWDVVGGASGLRPFIQTVEHRGKILLQHIMDKKLQLKRDL